MAETWPGLLPGGRRTLRQALAALAPEVLETQPDGGAGASGGGRWPRGALVPGARAGGRGCG